MFKEHTIYLMLFIVLFMGTLAGHYLKDVDYLAVITILGLVCVVMFLVLMGRIIYDQK